MKQLNKLIYLVLFACLLVTGCKDEPMAVGGTFGEGTVTLQFVAGSPLEITTRADDDSNTSAGEDSRLENALVFAFDGDGNCVAKRWVYLNGGTTMSMYLPGTTAGLYAVCNLQDPETVMNSVSTLAELNGQAVTISEADGAYKGKYVMSGKPTDGAYSSGADSYTISLTRLAAKFNVTIVFDPVTKSDQFMLSEITLHNIPRGSWLLPQTSEKIPFFERETQEGNLIPVFTSDGGDKADYVYNENATVMNGRFFEKDALEWEDVRSATVDNTGFEVKTSFNLFENHRGTLDITDVGWSKNWPELVNAGADNQEMYAQLWKKDLAESAGFTYASYLTIKGFYNQLGTNYETTYYVYLGKDNFSDYNVERNTKYDMTVTIQTIDKIDTRVEKEILGDIAVYYNEDNVLDTHFNAEQTLLYAQEDWEMWVENPEENPWLELSLEKEYHPHTLGQTEELDKVASSRISGSAGMRYVYVHTDEYVPLIASPESNTASIRRARVGYRLKGSDEAQYFTVSQYPAQMVVLDQYDPIAVKHVRDTFYVERIMEKKNLQWGFLKYWSRTTDDLMAYDGYSDGLGNTKTLYDVALNGDRYSDPAYPSGTIPSDVALRYVIDKNRDRNGNGKIDNDEIVWYMPAVYELQALQAALADRNVTFEGGDDFFYSSTPSAADPAGITPGFVWYVKMQSGKSAVGQRDLKYNVIAIRQKNADKGSQTAGGEGTIDKNEEWNDDEEVIMPKY